MQLGWLPKALSVAGFQLITKSTSAAYFGLLAVIFNGIRARY
jgi:hypothetical protein